MYEDFVAAILRKASQSVVWKMWAVVLPVNMERMDGLQGPNNAEGMSRSELQDT